MVHRWSTPLEVLAVVQVGWICGLSVRRSDYGCDRRELPDSCAELGLFA